MKQRLGLAGALIGRPPSRILEEPTNGLDRVGIHEIRTLVRSLPQQYDCTVLVSSHLLPEVELMADDIGILNHGRLLFEGAMETLKNNARAAGFLSLIHICKDNLVDFAGDADAHAALFRRSAGRTVRYPGCFAFFRTCSQKFCKAFSESCKNYRFCIDISV